MKTQLRFTNFFLTALVITAVMKVSAQDIHFSQFYTQPWMLNPAKVGFFNADYRLGAAYRTQWKSVTIPFVTFAGSAEFNREMKGASKDLLGIGVHAFTDRAGDANYTTNNIGLSLAYSFGLDRYHTNFLGIGANVNMLNSFFDITKMRFDNEYTGSVLNEKITTTNFATFDFGMGMDYNFIPNDRFNLSVGQAIHHINNPRMSFTNYDASILSKKYVSTFSATYSINSKYQLFPRAYVAIQGPHTEINTGAFFRVKLDNEKKDNYAFYLGSWYRWGDAVIAVARLDYREFSIGLSYDVNTSKLFTITEGRGGAEITLSYMGKKSGKGNKRIKCPKL